MVSDCGGCSKEVQVVLQGDDPAVPSSSSTAGPPRNPSAPSVVGSPTAPSLAAAGADLSSSSPDSLKGRQAATPLSMETVASASSSQKDGTPRPVPGQLSSKGKSEPLGDAKQTLKSMTANGQPGFREEVGKIEAFLSNGPSRNGGRLPMDADMAVKIMAYKDRQERRGKKKLGISGEEKYLSQVPEVERDIPFHFMFEVNGELNEIAVKNACESELAQALRQNPDTEVTSQTSKSGQPPEKLPAKTYRSGSATFLPYVCLCEVPRVEQTNPSMTRRPSNSKVRLAKISFRTLLYGKLTKACNSASDAENCCMVFIVAIDDKGTSILPRLDEIEKSVLQMTESIPPTRRPVPAIFLLHKPSADLKKWKKTLEEYEVTKGTTLRYGPMSIEDGNAIYEAFASLATMRITAHEQGFTSKQLWSSNVRKLAWPLVNLPPSSESALNRSKSAASTVSSVSSIGNPF